MHPDQAVCVEVPSISAPEASSLDSPDFLEHHRPDRLLYLASGTEKGAPSGSQHLFHAALADDHEQAVFEPYQLTTPIARLLPLELS
jgi:hypothetical protein